jgi:integral membrane sensor domain MASE1
MKRKAFPSVIAFALAYGLLAFVSMRQRDPLTLSTLYWPPAGLLLGTLMLAPLRRWPCWMGIASLLHLVAGMLVAGRSLPVALVFVLGDQLACCATAAAWRRVAASTMPDGVPHATTSDIAAAATTGDGVAALHAPDHAVFKRRFDTLAGTLAFIALTAANSALGGWLVALGLRAVTPATPLAHWYVWSIAAFVGCAITTPLLIAWAGLRFAHLAEQNLPRLWMGLAAALALLAGTTAVFNSRLGLWLWNGHNPVDLTYAPLLFLALVAITWGPAGASLTVAGLALIAGSYTSSGLGPFANAAAFSGQPLLAVQGYLGAGALLSLLIGALNADRERAMQDALSWQKQQRQQQHP